MPKIDLPNCPLCGGKVERVLYPGLDEYRSIIGFPFCAVKCKSCAAEIWNLEPDEMIEVATKEWNTRASGWIPCSERLPEQDGEYLVFTEYEDVFKCTFDSNEENKWGFEQDYHDPDTLGWAGTTWTAVETVTHWMPLPEKPETEDNT